MSLKQTILQVGPKLCQQRVKNTSKRKQFSQVTLFSRRGSWPVGVRKILHLQCTSVTPPLWSSQRLRAATRRQTPVHSPTSACCTASDVSTHGETPHYSKQSAHHHHHHHHHHHTADHHTAFNNSNNYLAFQSSTFKARCTNNPSHLQHFSYTQLHYASVTHNSNHPRSLQSQHHFCIFHHSCTALNNPYPSSHHRLPACHQPSGFHSHYWQHREQQAIPQWHQGQPREEQHCRQRGRTGRRRRGRHRGSGAWVARSCAHFAGCTGHLRHSPAELLLLHPASSELEGTEEEDGTLPDIVEREKRLHASDKVCAGQRKHLKHLKSELELTFVFCLQQCF